MAKMWPSLGSGFQPDPIQPYCCAGSQTLFTTLNQRSSQQRCRIQLDGHDDQLYHRDNRGAIAIPGLILCAQKNPESYESGWAILLIPCFILVSAFN